MRARDEARSSLLGVWALLAFAGCSPSELFLALPPHGEASGLIVLRHAPSERTATAVDLGDEAWSVQVPVDSTTELRIEALLYASSLEELGLAPGRLEWAAAPEGRPIPAPRSVYETSFDGDSVTAWREGVAEEIAARGLRVKGRDGCAVFTPRYYHLGSDSPPSFAIALPSGEVLIGGPGFGLRRLTESGLDVVHGPFEHPVTHAAYEGRNTATPRLWLRTEDGALHYGAPELPLALQRAETATTPPMLAFDASMSAAGVSDVFFVDREGRFLRDRREVRTELGRFTHTGRIHAARVVRSRPGEVLAVFAGDPHAISFRAGVAQPLPSLPRSFEMPTDATWDVGYVLGTSQGAILRVEPGGYREVARGPGHEILALAPFEGGYLGAGGNGYVAQFLDGQPVCAPVQVGGAAILHLSLLAGRHPVVVPGALEVGASEAAVVVLWRD